MIIFIKYNTSSIRRRIAIFRSRFHNIACSSALFRVIDGGTSLVVVVLGAACDSARMHKLVHFLVANNRRLNINLMHNADVCVRTGTLGTNSVSFVR